MNPAASRQPWSAHDEDCLVAAVEAGKRVRDAARDLGRSYWGARKRLSVLIQQQRVGKRIGNSWSSQREIVAQMVREGNTDNAIALLTGRSLGSVRVYRSRSGLNATLATADLVISSWTNEDGVMVRTARSAR